MSWLENIGLKILELRGEILAGIFAACVAVLLLNNGDIRYARDLSQEALAWIFLLAVLTFFLIIARAGKGGFNAVGALRKRRRDNAEGLRFQNEVLKFFDTLSAQEREVLSYLVLKNQQSFNADMMAKVIGTLRQKNLIAMGTGVMSQHNAPT